MGMQEVVYASLVDLVLKDRDNFVISKYSLFLSFFGICLSVEFRRWEILLWFWKKSKKYQNTQNKRKKFQFNNLDLFQLWKIIYKNIGF